MDDLTSGLAPGGATGHMCRKKCLMTSTPAIAVDRLVKVYKTVTAVDGISFSLEPGSCTALLGGNGAGKTTTIATIMGLVQPTSGRVTRAGRRDAAAAPPRAAPDEFREPVRGHADAAHGAAEPQRVRHALRLADVAGAHRRRWPRSSSLADLLDRPTGKLSSGQKTRVALAKSLINQPEVLLLDEPTASLDPDTADWVRSLARALPRGARRHRAARLAQHGRGRAAVRPRHHDEARQDRGRRHAGAI